MNNQQVCTQCHSTSFHFDRRKHAIVCDMCGWVQNSTEQNNEQLLYDQQRQKAIAFVKAKDYNSALPYLNKMRQMRPDDEDIYYLHMMGLSDCCQNLLLNPNDAQEYTEFERNWAIYSSLSRNQGVFQDFLRRRHLALQKELQTKINKFSIMSIISYFVLLLSICLISGGVYWAILSGIGIIIFIYNMRPLTNLIKNWKAYKQSYTYQSI